MFDRSNPYHMAMLKSQLNKMAEPHSPSAYSMSPGFPLHSSFDQNNPVALHQLAQHPIVQELHPGWRSGHMGSSVQNALSQLERLYPRQSVSMTQKATTDDEDNDQDEKVAKVMDEFKRGKLKTSAGKKVTSRDQALAIAMSESEQKSKA